MGHCFSCFQDPADAHAPVPPADTAHHNDEMTEIGEASRARPMALSEYALAEPLLQARASDASAQKSGTHYHYPKNHNTLAQSPVPVAADPPVTTQKIHINNDKSQKSFYQKLSQSDTKVSESKINQLFDQYKEASEDAILAEGIENLCNDLQLNPDEFKVLVLAWKLNASQMCRFTRAEFLQGLKNMKTDSIKGIQTRLTELTEELHRNPELFKDLYRFTFKFGLDVGVGQRILPSDVAVVLWRLIFTYSEPPILKRWLGYLENNAHIRGIPKDTWYMFLNFCEYVREDLSSYDDTEAWPSLFDDFVEYENDQMNQNISKIDIKLQN